MTASASCQHYICVHTSPDGKTFVPWKHGCCFDLWTVKAKLLSQWLVMWGGFSRLRRKPGKNAPLPRPGREEQHFANADGARFALLFRMFNQRLLLGGCSVSLFASRTLLLCLLLLEIIFQFSEQNKGGYYETPAPGGLLKTTLTCPRGYIHSNSSAISCYKSAFILKFWQTRADKQSTRSLCLT